MQYQLTKTFRKLGGLKGAIEREAAKLNVRPCKSITMSFDPFTKDAETVREFHKVLTSEKVSISARGTRLKIEILSDRSEGTIQCSLTGGANCIFKCKNLQIFDVLTLFNKHISILEKAPEVKTFGFVKRKLK